jgi:molybdopterin-containing oxidoreductase family iron-sulfur binding subunit
MDRHHRTTKDLSLAASASSSPAMQAASRRFQSVEELLGHASVEEARVYENGVPPLAGDGSAVERRDFMKILGATFAAASATAACGRLPVHKALPYVDKPEELTFGKANYYATVCRGCSAGCGVLVKSREGRPIKVEGNPDFAWNSGSVCAIGQATVVGLYDGDRVRSPKIDGKDATWKDFDAKAAAALAEYAGEAKGLALVTGTLSGPATGDIVRAFLAKFPGARHVVYDGPFGAGAIAQAHGLTHGKAAVPRYDFAKAEVILSFGADFLGTWIAPVAFAKQYAPGRKLNDAKKSMTKHIQVETRLSLTGSNADERVRILPSELRGVVLALAGKLAKGVDVPAGKAEGAMGKQVEAWAKLLSDNKGKSLVVADSNDLAVQAAVNAINESIGSYGATVDLKHPFHGLSAQADAEVALLDAAAKGEVTGIILVGVNPAYDSKHAAKWAEAIKKAKLSVAVTTRADETAALCKLVAASHHGLESWGDHEPLSGLVAVQQPLVTPLFDTRNPLDLLLGWAGVQTADGKAQTAYGAISEYWKGAVWPRGEEPKAFQVFWDETVAKGFAQVKAIGAPVLIKPLQAKPAAVKPGGPEEAAAPQPAGEAIAAAAEASPAAAAAPAELPAAASAVALPLAASAVALASGVTDTVAPVIDIVPPKPGQFDPAATAKALATAAPSVAQAGKFEVVLYPKNGMGAGEHANNPFLQELPDPISKATWGNYAAISPKTAQDLGNLLSSDVVKVSNGAVSVELPVVLSPGLHDGAIALPVGYGRIESMGRIALGVGKNVYPFAGLADLPKADIAATGAKDPVAFSQTHHSYEHRDAIRETSLAAWLKDAKAGNKQLEPAMRDPSHSDPRVTKSIWDRHQYTGYKWSMAIDLNACTGCGACVIACNVENNIPVVGKKEVLTRREMHWMRIDRYYSEKKTYKEGEYDWDATKDDLLALAENPEVVHMPMMCQHCDNAPCETVCPVLATMHTSEGLNAQAYNRCIGTRYCANNCPYKVRRFNWFNYPTREMEDKFDIDLVALALNPEIVKRSRGVMEKCTFCVHRIQDAKSVAVQKSKKPWNLADVEKAEAEGKKLQPRTLRDNGEGELIHPTPACAQTCPADAIKFGDMNDSESQVRKAYDDPRNYSALVEIGTQPAVSYMTKVRNSDRA